ncbi:MAG TPA: hypothetical protein VGN08_01065 [Solirubrobacteraceae bacterium]|jgi:hypothetical protein
MTGNRPRNEAELVEFVRSIDVEAPDSLHRQVEAMVAGARRGPRRRPATPGRAFGLAPRIAAAAGIAAALAAVAITVSLSGGSKGVSEQTAMLVALRQPTAPAPPESQTNHAQLAMAVDGISFPYWSRGLGWRPTGQRSDRIDGRTVTTVFYGNARGQRIGYAIVPGSAPRLSGGVLHRRGGTSFRVLEGRGPPAVVWLRAGHLCVVSGRGVSPSMLLRLASWHPRGGVAS